MGDMRNAYKMSRQKLKGRSYLGDKGVDGDNIKVDLK
jgi:hypothetical protein